MQDIFITVDGVSYNATDAAKKPADQFAKETAHHGDDKTQKARHAKLKQALADMDKPVAPDAPAAK